MIGIECFAATLPPSSDALHGKLSGIMIDTHVDKATLMDQIVDAIGHRFAISQGMEVIHIHIGMLSFGLPIAPIVLEVPNQFLLLAID